MSRWSLNSNPGLPSPKTILETHFTCLFHFPEKQKDMGKPRGSQFIEMTWMTIFSRWCLLHEDFPASRMFSRLNAPRPHSLKASAVRTWHWLLPMKLGSVLPFGFSRLSGFQIFESSYWGSPELPFYQHQWDFFPLYSHNKCAFGSCLLKTQQFIYAPQG